MPKCMVAYELNSARLVKSEIAACPDNPPFNPTPTSIIIAYYGSTAMGCFRKLNWPMPENILDLYTEFRCLSNGNDPVSGYSFLGALSAYGLKDTLLTLHHDSADGTEDILKSCTANVKALAALLSKMINSIDLPRALLRGKYMKSIAEIEWNGIPIDIEKHELLKKHWVDIKTQLIDRVDTKYGVYDGTTFKQDRFRKWLNENRIQWPLLQSGALNLDQDTFKLMANAYPKLAPLRELRNTLSNLRINDLAVGSDGRNRCDLVPFRSKTGRNQPSSSRFIFGLSIWYRSLIKPNKGYGLAYIDWGQQEFGIAAALSQDERMIEAYNSHDPYLEFAKQCGAVPLDATKQTHPDERELYKTCVLAVQYGMGEKSLARSINRSIAEARLLLDQHRATYKKFWKWSNDSLDFALLNGHLNTALGWKIQVKEPINERSLRNFPMQANGAEILRLACILATDGKIKICAPVHDALLIEAPLDKLGHDIEKTKKYMQQAGETILDGFKLRTDVEEIHYPERYQDKRGFEMWNLVNKLLEQKRGGKQWIKMI